MPDAAYYRRWRAAHPEYRTRENERSHQRRLTVPRGDRTGEYARRRSRAAEEPGPLPELFPDLVRGAVLVFREEELARDMRQEEWLAILEGRDPEEAAARYKAWETTWWHHTAPLYPTLRTDEGRDPVEDRGLTSPPGGVSDG